MCIHTQPYPYLINMMKSAYPVSPLPGNEQFKICIDFLDHESFALPVVEFCNYAHVNQINWMQCSWENDLLSLNYDTTIFPHYIFSTMFLRYYFPACLNLTIKYFLGDYCKEEVGNADSFVEHTIDSIIDNYDKLNMNERELMYELLKLIENNPFYDYKDECIKLRKVVVG